MSEAMDMFWDEDLPTKYQNAKTDEERELIYELGCTLVGPDWLSDFGLKEIH